MSNTEVILQEAAGVWQAGRGWREGREAELGQETCTGPPHSPALQDCRVTHINSAPLCFTFPGGQLEIMFGCYGLLLTKEELMCCTNLFSLLTEHVLKG